jgi:hypothetical protein
VLLNPDRCSLRAATRLTCGILETHVLMQKLRGVTKRAS